MDRMGSRFDELHKRLLFYFRAACRKEFCAEPLTFDCYVEISA